MTDFQTLLLLPFELLLPVLGLLLIQSESPITSLIYRSFLGSIAALIYALIGAPDVALTEVMVGTLLSSLIYIVTIRSCYTVVIIIDRSSPPDDSLKSSLKLIFSELHLKVVYQEEDFDELAENNFKFLSSSKLSGSPHGIIHGSTFYAEVKTLLDDISQTAAYQALSVPVHLEKAVS